MTEEQAISSAPDDAAFIIRFPNGYHFAVPADYRVPVYAEYVKRKQDGEWVWMPNHGPMVYSLAERWSEVMEDAAPDADAIKIKPHAAGELAMIHCFGAMGMIVVAEDRSGDDTWTVIVKRSPYNSASLQKGAAIRLIAKVDA